MQVISRVNVGCGRTPTEGWLNYDNSLSIRISKLPMWLLSLLKTLNPVSDRSYSYILFLRTNDIRFCDAAKHIPLEDNSMEVVYTSHMLEHLDRTEAQAFLKESYRVLCQGGILRIAVPSLKKKIEQYLIDKDADALVDSLYTCVDKPSSILNRLKLATVGPRHHHWMYDETSLCKLLDNIGFHKVVSLPAGETIIPDPGHLNLSERADESIYVEAQKL